MELTKKDATALKSFGLHEHKCFICGKRFECKAGYVYKKSKGKEYVYFCSYTCMRRAEKNEKEKKNAV